MLFLSFLIAMLPILWLILALCGLKMAGHKACMIALILTAILSIVCKKQTIPDTGSAALEGILNALWPICLVIIGALFTYNLVVKTGAMEVIKRLLSGVSTDERILGLLIGWGFGNFMEGMAGFGTAVAIPASMLAGIGLNPLLSVVACLVVNSTPTAFGSVGVPTITLASVSGTDILALSGQISLMQAFITFLSPFLMVCILGRGIKALKGMFLFTLASSLSFLIPWILTACFIGPELPDMIGAVCSLFTMILMASRMDRKKEQEERAEIEVKGGMSPLAAGSPFILIFVLLLLTSNLVPFIHDAIGSVRTNVQVYTGENPGTLSFSWIGTPGVMIFIAAILGGMIQKAELSLMLGVLGDTLKKYYKTIITICSVMAVAKIMGYSMMISDIARFLVAATGPFYPLIAPLIGALGAFVTGSGTSTNVLFGGLQAQTALDLSLDPIRLAAANVMGAGIGKMICPQGIAIGAGAIGAVGSESKILRSVFVYFLFYVAAAGLLSYLFVTVF